MSATPHLNTEKYGITLTEQIHEFERDEIGPDELYDLRRELVAIGEEDLATRVDIEYGNSLRYTDYRPQFASLELFQIVTVLGNIQYRHVMNGNRNRADIVDDLIDMISHHFAEWSEQYDVPLDEYLGVTLGVREDADTVERDHTHRMEQAKHDRDSEDITVETEEGPLDEIGPDEVEEKEIHPGPPTPPSPDSPTGESDNNGDDPEAG